VYNLGSVLGGVLGSVLRAYLSAQVKQAGSVRSWERTRRCTWEHLESFLESVSQAGWECTIECNQECASERTWECAMKCIWQFY